MKGFRTNIILPLMALLSIPFFTGSMAARPTIKASVDSSQITMGYQTAIRLDIIDNATSPSQVIVDQNAFPKEIEIIDWVYGDTTDLGNSLVEMKRALVVQSFKNPSYFFSPLRSMPVESQPCRRKRYERHQPPGPTGFVHQQVV